MKDAKGHGSNPRGGKRHFYDPRFRTADGEKRKLDEPEALTGVLGQKPMSDRTAAEILASGPKSAPAPVHDAMKITGNGGVTDQGNRVGMTKKYDPGHRDSNAFQHDYHPESVNRAIENSGRFGGGKIGKREGRMIHAILKGRGK